MGTAGRGDNRVAQSNDTAETARRESRQDYPEDRFDRVERSGRVGAHRIIAKPRHVWQYLIAGLLGFALLTTAGILFVQSTGGSSFSSAGADQQKQPTAQQTPKGALDPEATVAVLNGTTVPNLASVVDQTITSENWGKILFSGNAADSAVEISAVFYIDPADEAAAEGLAEKLGGVSTYQTENYQEYGVRLVVLLGADYAGPGLDEAKQAAGE